MLLIVILYALLALTFIIAKYALSFADPLFLIGFRMTIAGLALLSYYYGKNKLKNITVPPLSWSDIAQVTLFHIYISFVFEFWALQYLSAGYVTILYSLTPFIAALLSFFLMNETLHFKQIIAIIIGFIGVTTSTIYSWHNTTPYNLLATFVLLVAIISGAYAWFIIKRLTHAGHSLIKINGTSMLCGGLLSFITWLLVHSFNITTPVQDWNSFLLYVGLLIFVSNIVVYNLYGFLIQKHSITLVTFAGFLCPIFGSLLSCIFFNQPCSIFDAFAILCVTIGLYLFSYAPRTVKTR